MKTWSKISISKFFDNVGKGIWEIYHYNRNLTRNAVRITSRWQTRITRSNLAWSGTSDQVTVIYLPVIYMELTCPTKRNWLLRWISTGRNRENRKQVLLHKPVYCWHILGGFKLTWAESLNEFFCSPWTVVRPPLSVSLSVNFSYFHPLLQNNSDNLIQTWHNASLH